MVNKNIDLKLLILCIIPFGFDKLYKGSVNLFLIKFLLHFIIIGYIWWIYDIVCLLMGKYKLNPLK